jgi:phosphate/sulfate permease
MSALVTKVLSSLHKQIISAVCLAAINFIEFYCIWEPSKVSKIATDNFYTGVLGVILSALLYSQAPKAPKKVEAKKD